MIQKPWIVIIIGICYLFSPLINLALSTWMGQVSFLAYISTFKSMKDIFEFFFIFPIAGLAILAFRWWSYPVFIATFFWSIYYNYLSYAAYPEFFPIYYLVAFYIVNLLLISYFLIPTVMAPYFNKRLRWWESSPRYHLNIKALFRVISKDDSELDVFCEIKNLSEGGALILLNSSDVLEKDKTLVLSFKYEGLELSLHGEVMHIDSVGSNYSGIRFLSSNEPSERKKLKKLLAACELLNVQVTRPKQVSWSSFRNWFVTFIKTGKGFIPEIKIQNKEK